MKRVTVTTEIVDYSGRVTWSHTETAEANTGDNPRFHVRDVETALEEARVETVRAVSSRFGVPPAGPTPEELEAQAAARAEARRRRAAAAHILSGAPSEGGV